LNFKRRAAPFPQTHLNLLLLERFYCSSLALLVVYFYEINKIEHKLIARWVEVLSPGPGLRCEAEACRYFERKNPSNHVKGPRAGRRLASSISHLLAGSSMVFSFVVAEQQRNPNSHPRG
jgi:hypothetical protein